MIRRSFRNAVILHLLLSAAACLLCAQTNLQSNDGYVRREGEEWIVGTSMVEKRVRLAGGRFSSVSLRNKLSGREYQDENHPSPEVRFFADGQDVSAPDWHWKLGGEQTAQGKQGELQLDVELESSGLRLTRHYIVYPRTSVIREWMTLRNSSGRAIRLSHVEFLDSRIPASMSHGLQFNYLTGGGNYNGSQLLKNEPISSGYRRSLDSNGGIQPGNYSSYLPLVFLMNPRASEGLAVGWDYLGHWSFEIGDQEDLLFGLRLELAGFEKDLPPGRRLKHPKYSWRRFPAESMNSAISCWIGNMPICGNSPIRNTLPKLAGQWIGRTRGWVKEALPAPITGEGGWRSICAT